MIVSRKTHAVSYLHGFIRCFYDYYFKKSVLNLTIAIYFCTFAIAIRPVGRFGSSDIVGKTKHSLLFRVQPKASETCWIRLAAPRQFKQAWLLSVCTIFGNNVTEIIVIRYSVWSALDYRIIEMHHAIGVVYSLLIVWGFHSEAAS